MKIPMVMSAEQMARSLYPGINAMAFEIVKKTIAVEMEIQLERWLRETFESGTVKSAFQDPESGKLQLIIEFDTEEVFGK